VHALFVDSTSGVRVGSERAATRAVAIRNNVISLAVEGERPVVTWREPDGRSGRFAP
jgi:hypothetical protein